MEQIAVLNETYVSILGVNGLFLIANFILLWMMFRGVTNANLHGANTFGKALHSVISLGNIWKHWRDKGRTFF